MAVNAPWLGATSTGLPEGAPSTENCTRPPAGEPKPAPAGVTVAVKLALAPAPKLGLAAASVVVVATLAAQWLASSFASTDPRPVTWS